ncbi:MAG: 5'-nucleotidase [Micavibrio aeruginosavorus]|nr:5'-nucleotidase [Micavibrio aeruginosavorus]
MPRPLGHIRILMSSRVLLDLEEGDRVFKEKGVAGYTDYMLCRGAYEKDMDPELGCRRLNKGPLFDFALAMNRLNVLSKTPMVEIGISCKDETDTALAIFRNLNASPLSVALEYRITTSGKPVSARTHRAFKTDLFLTRSEADAQTAIDLDIAAAVVNFPPKGAYACDHDAHPIRIVVDGDAVAFGDSAEVRYREAIDSGKTYEEGLRAYKEAEKRDVNDPVESGPFTPILAKISQLNSQFPKDDAPFEISLLTARGGPASDRALSTVLKHGIKFNGESGFMGGAAKHEWLAEHQPHVFFDDQQTHLEHSAEFCPTGRVPYKTGSPMQEYLLRKRREAEAAAAAPAPAAGTGGTQSVFAAAATGAVPDQPPANDTPRKPRGQARQPK